jgi:glycolate oxidase FAD binding subunit
MSQVAGTAVPLDVSSVGEVQDVVRDAASRGVAVRVAGAGTWLHAGRPVDATSTVALRALRGIVDYTPGDLTITAWAGTSLEELDDAVAEHAQWIALDPHGSRRGTLGATVATASHGPLAASFGTPRDVVLGVQCVTGDAEVVHGGARVVKHVAGFDLVRLMTGAWGTLGIITQLTVRLRARAPVDVTYAVAPAAASLRDWWPAYRSASVTPLAAELLSPGTARALGIGQETLLLIRVAGNDEAVSAQADALRSLGAVHVVASDVWTRFADSDPPEPFAALRLSQRIGNVAAAWDDAMTLAADVPDARVHATVDRGVVRIVFPSMSHEGLSERLQRVSAASTRIFEVLPAALWPQLAPSSARDPLSTRIRAAFDPERRLNRGILGET